MKRGANACSFDIDEFKIDIEGYLSQINSIIEYYNNQSEKNKRKYYACCFARIIASTIIFVIPLILGVNLNPAYISILASVIIFSETYVNVARICEKWMKYRDICNLLLAEQRAFVMGLGCYAKKNTKDETFIKNCEVLIRDEMCEWITCIDLTRNKCKMPSEES